MVLLTLTNGNRIEIDADEIEEIEPTPGGAVVHCRSGPALTVMQNARTLQARVNAAIAAKGVQTESSEEAHPAPAVIDLAKNDAIEGKQIPTFRHRTKRLLLGRGSTQAFMIGEAGRARPV